MKRSMTCIICPRGCEMQVEYETGKLISVCGNACKRGAAYAEDEVTHPKRSISSTVRTKSGHLLAVKTAKAIPKELVFECMKEINTVTASDEAQVGDVIISNVLGVGVDIVASSEPYDK